VTPQPPTTGSDGRDGGAAPPSAEQPPVTLVLLDRVRDGDADAVNRLLERHRAAIRRMIDHRMDRVIERRVDASDIVQDVMIEANRRLADYLANPTMPFRLWLRHMARDRLIDAHRRHRVAATRSLDREVPLVAHDGDGSVGDGLVGVADRELTPAAAATWHELERRFAAAVELLDDGDRQIVLLRHFEHLTTAEAAEVLGLTKPAAGMRYLRAMRRLRGLLEGGSPEP
jgi:RNA polymerase sigma-70 factor (ECF subfamily)